MPQGQKKENVKLKEKDGGEEWKALLPTSVNKRVR